MFLEEKKDQPCPDNDGAKVVYAYYGFDNSNPGKQAGYASPDQIFINSYSAGTKKLTDLKTELKKLLMLNETVKTTAAALKAAQDALSQFTGKIGLDAALKKLEALKAKLKATQDKITALNAEIAEIETQLKAVDASINADPKPKGNALQALKDIRTALKKSLASKKAELNNLPKPWTIENDIKKQEAAVAAIEKKNRVQT
jgi:chromosome segregation ATPase